VVNLEHLRVAAGSLSGFLVANVLALVIYRPENRPRLYVTIAAFAIADSFIFPLVAFDHLTWWVVGGQIAAKIIGALIWTWIFQRYVHERPSQQDEVGTDASG
jgi:hypothetical protein